jgi:hypothetical protein
MRSFPKQRIGSGGYVSISYEIGHPAYLDESVVDFQVPVCRNGPAQDPPPVHEPCPLCDLPERCAHLILELSDHLQDLVRVVVAASAPEHEQPEGVNEPHGANIFMPDRIGEYPEGQGVSDKEFAVLEDIVTGVKRGICPRHHRVLADDLFHHLIKGLPPWLPPLQLFDCIELKDDPNKLFVSECHSSWSWDSPDRVMSSKRAASECSMSS